MASTHTRIKAPGEGRAATRAKWLLRQLKSAPPNLRITARIARTRTTTSLLLSDALAKPEELLLADDRKREPVSFDVAFMRNMGSKKGKDKGSFVAETMEQVLIFYGEVLQNIRGWTRPPARLSEEQIVVEEPDEHVPEMSEEPLPEQSDPKPDIDTPPPALPTWYGTSDL